MANSSLMSAVDVERNVMFIILTLIIIVAAFNMISGLSMLVQDKTKDIGYRNGLFLNADVVTETEWTVEKITARTDKIVSTLLDMYKW